MGWNLQPATTPSPVVIQINRECCCSLAAVHRALVTSAAHLLHASWCTAALCNAQPFLSQVHSGYAQARGSLSTATSAASGEPCAGSTIYLHATSGGADTMTLSARPPSSPKRTPLRATHKQGFVPAWLPALCLLASLRGAPAAQGNSSRRHEQLQKVQAPLWTPT